ncbi:hypothetical protein B0T13DRAFT_486688 [Neurospora crassa]|nr:hypothetical protein B0T13DRAFT_486688 [Neurospora crassa]
MQRQCRRSSSQLCGLHAVPPASCASARPLSAITSSSNFPMVPGATKLPLAIGTVAWVTLSHKRTCTSGTSLVEASKLARNDRHCVIPNSPAAQLALIYQQVKPPQVLIDPTEPTGAYLPLQTRHPALGDLEARLPAWQNGISAPDSQQKQAAPPQSVQSHADQLFRST